MSKEPELPEHELIPQIVSEIVDHEADMVAISCIMVMKNGSICTRLAYKDNTRLILLAGVTLHHHDLISAITEQNNQQMSTGSINEHK